MTRVIGPLVTAVIALALFSPVQAQWARREPPGVPKAADGKVDLTAPTPRTPDGKPDLYGIWEGSRRRDEPGGPPRPPRSSFANIGANIEGGLPYQPWAKELMTKRVASRGFGNPDANCMAQGVLQYHSDPQPSQIFNVPGGILILYESNYGRRMIYTDGRPLPKPGEPTPYWNGYSVGRWEGDTLVVTSNNFRGVEGGHGSDGWFDTQGNPYTDALTLTERFRRVNFGTLEIDITIDDPKAYTRPFTVRVEKAIVADGWELTEFICHENQQYLELMKDSR